MVGRRIEQREAQFLLGRYLNALGNDDKLIHIEVEDFTFQNLPSNPSWTRVEIAGLGARSVFNFFVKNLTWTNGFNDGALIQFTGSELSSKTNIPIHQGLRNGGL